MDLKTYSEKALGVAKKEVLQDKGMCLMNAALGLTGEAGEFADHIKKAMFQDAEMDEGKLIAELGDICWYVNEAAFALGVTFEEVLAKNIAKLAARYPSGMFDPERCRDRDTEAERVAMEMA